LRAPLERGSERRARLAEQRDVAAGAVEPGAREIELRALELELAQRDRGRDGRAGRRKLALDAREHRGIARRRGEFTLRERTEYKDGTIYFDVTDQALEGYNKFIPYYLHPKSVYSVGLSKTSFRTKVSVGSNPWTSMRPAEMVNLAQVCERYGGGGHARVGAISFEPNQEERAREAAREIVAELRQSYRKQHH